MSKLKILLIAVLFSFTFPLPAVETACAAGVDDLILAVWGFDTAKAAALIDGGVDVNGKDANGTYPLILACSYKDNDEMIKLLLEKKISVDRDKPADHGAVISGVFVFQIARTEW